MDRDKLMSVLRGMCDEAGGQAAWAAKKGLSPAYVSDVLNGRREPGYRLLKAMGYKRIVGYRKSRETEGLE